MFNKHISQRGTCGLLILQCNLLMPPDQPKLARSASKPTLLWSSGAAAAARRLSSASASGALQMQHSSSPAASAGVSATFHRNACNIEFDLERRLTFGQHDVPV